MPKSKLTAVDLVQYVVKVVDKKRKLYVFGIKFLIPIPKKTTQIIFDTVKLNECLTHIARLEAKGFRSWTETDG